MARHHEAVAWLRRAARSCWAACFLIELRPAQMPGSYIASASQVLISALERRYGLGSLAHRAGKAVACGSA